MSTFLDNLTARQSAVYFADDRGYSRPATIVSGGVTTAAVQVCISRIERKSDIFNDRREYTVHTAMATIPAAVALTQSASTHWGKLTDADGNEWTIDAIVAETPAYTRVKLARETTQKHGQPTGRLS